MTAPHIQNILKNKRAYFEYEIDDTFEAGLKLTGSEVKSLRDGHVSFEGAFGKLKGNEIFLHDLTIQPYPLAGHFNHEPTRPRKMLLHRHEIRKIETKLKIRGYTLVPIEMYFKDGYAKLKIGLGRGKKLHDKREEIKKKETLRNLQKMKKY